MKELQNFVYKYMDSLKHHKRYLAMLTALSMLVTFIVPLILMEPADSMTGILVCKKVVHTHNAECYDGNTLICDIEEHIHTNECYKNVSLLSLKGEGESNTNVHDDNENVPNAGGGLNPDGSYTSADAHEVVNGEGYYNPSTLPLYTLLFGEGINHWVDSSKSLEENLEIVDDEYFLGFASDFCAFIESDFTATDADAEGRIFIGGDLTFKNAWNYQVGAGDYGQFKSIWNTDEYGHLTGFASGIIGGKVYRLATMTTGAYGSLAHDTSGITDRHVDKKNNDVFLYPEEGAYKRFIVGNLKDSLHYDEDYETRGDKEKIDLPYERLCNHLYYDHNCSICGDTAETMADKHRYLGEVNELSQFYLYDDVSTILERTFDTLRARSLSLASVQAIDATIDDNGTLSLNASDIGDAKTAYFKINKWESIKRVVITVPDDRITYTQTGDKEEKYSNGKKTIKNLDLNIIVTCGDEEIKIEQNIPTFILAKDKNEKPDNDSDGVYYGYKISNRGKDDGANATNNHPVSSNILYNFYNAAKVTFTGDTNFNGTIYAPNASVTAPDECKGHLSGALIAKSFKGGLEFGYRPYRGGVDIFGMTSGYAIPVDKFGDDEKTFLPGALFAIKENAKFVSLFESGNGTNFAALPSRVDFTGSTIYKRDEVTQEEGADKTFAGNTVAGEKLLASVDFTLHTDSSCTDNNKIENKATLDNLWTKIYLKPNQNVNIDDSADYIVDEPDNNGIYTIQLIKPVTSLTITARNQSDSTDEKTATVNFTPKMVLMATSNGNQKFEINRDIDLQAIDAPIGDIWYAYYVNNEVIKNESTQYNERIQSPKISFKPNAPGDYIFSVKAFVKVNEEFYEISQATANKVTITKPELPNDLKITLSGETLEGDGTNSNYTITSGNNIKVGLAYTGDLPDDTIVEYAFYNSGYQSYNEFITNDIVGKDLLVKVRIALPNEEPVVLQETLTVNFKEMNYNDYSESYEVNSNNYYYFSLQNVPNGATVEYYFNKKKLDGYSVAQTVVGDNIPVYAYVSANGLVEKVEGKSVKGYYNNLLAIKTSTGPYIVGNSINVSVDYAPYGSKVVFMALDENNEEVWTSNEQTVYNTTCGDYFMPKESGNYTFKAFIKLADNPDNILTSNNIKVEAKPVTGQFTINPTEVFTGNTVEFRVYNATVGANVTFQIKDQSGNYQNPLNGTVDNNGECKIPYTPLQAGNYTVEALISKDGKSASLQQNLTVKENSSALTGEFSVTPSSLNTGANVAINVYNATNGATVEVYITWPDGNHTDRQSGNINNGSFSCQYSNTGVEGVYTVNVRLILNGITYDIPAKTFTLSSSSNSDTSRTGELTLSGGTYVPNVPIRFTVNNTNGNYVAFNVVYNGNGQTVYSYGKEVVNGSVTVEFTPGGTGSHTVKATIDGVTELTQTFEVVDNSSNQQPESDPTAGLSISVSKLPYVVNTDQVTLSVINLPEGARVEYYISGQKVADSANPTFKPDRLGQFDLEARITFADNSTRSIYTKIYDTTNVPQNTMSYAFRKYLSILAAEDANSDLNDNKIIITTADDSARISNVRLTFPSEIDAKETKFKLKVTSNGSNSTDYYPTNANVSDQSPYYLDIPVSVFSSDSDITEIEITPVSGSITIDKCYPTLIKDETKITQKYVQGFTLKKYEEKEIVIDDWTIADNAVQTLDSISFNLGSNGKIYYALIEKPEPGEEAKTPVFIEANASDENVISIPNLNAENIEKIKIYTTDAFLTVNDYTINAYIGSKDTYENGGLELRTKTQDIVNYYTLVEQQAPVGYFKEDSIYNIEVKETIILDKVNSTNIPTEVITTITAKDMNGNVALSYKLKISNMGTDERIITILGENDVEVHSFTLKKNGDGELTVTSDTITTSEWDTTKDGENDGYYLDVDAMMIVPVPQPIKYTNRIGLLFRKIDKGGAAVNGVEINLVPNTGKNGESLWYWDNNTSEWLIDYTNLPILIVDDPNPVYKIKETYAGGKYEIADDIYFMRTGEKEVKYWLGSETMPPERTDENQLTVLNFTQNLESRVIRMENTRVTGVKLKLKKTDVDTGLKIEGDKNYAVFALYANDGTELLNPINVVNGEADIVFDPNKVYDTTYVENGYLKPGAYYLREIKAPNGYETSTKDFYFNVIEDSDGAYKAESSEIMYGVTEVKETQSDGKVHTITTFKKDALKLISEGIAADTINASTPIIQFKFKTDSGEKGFGNAKFKAKVNGTEVSPNTAKYPSGCDIHANGMSFQAETVPVQFTVQQLCDLFDVSYDNFNTINEFVIDTWNSTTVKDLDFWVIENPINSGNNGLGGGESGGNNSDDAQVLFEGVTYKVVPEDDEKEKQYLKFTSEALNSISDEMITSDDKIISFTLSTVRQNEINDKWGNSKIFGTVNNELKSKDIAISSAEMNYSLSAKDLLEELGVQVTDENVVEQFRLLTEFNVESWNHTRIINIDFAGVTDNTENNTGSDTENNTSNDTENNTSNDTENNTGNDTENNTGNNTENTTPATPALKIERETVIISNSPLGDTMDLRVDKKWVGDSDVTELRKPVNVVLKRKTGVNGSYETFKPEKQKEEHITLNSLNDWSYTWKDLPRYANGPNDDGDDVLYYYTVAEITTVTGYTSEVPNVNINEGGIVTITNTLEPVSIDVEKIWNSDGKGNVSAFLPQTLIVKLQAKVSDDPEAWQDIPGKTLTLTAANKQEGDTEEKQTWKGTFENLPKGYEYRIVEGNVSAVWDVKYNKREVSAEETKAETIEGFKLSNTYNVATGSIAVQKLWQDLTGETSLPYSITVDLYRSVIAPSYTETDAPYTEDYKTDYARLLQHSLYFYDANMCGTDVAANSALAWRTNCHTEDEVVGGYHDAGDHAVFGLPQGYTASMLGWTYYEFIKDNTTDAGGKINSDDARHFKVILERFYDFFVDSVRYSDGKISEILVQKGDGNVDHSYWGAPENQTERKITGEDSEMFWRDYGADIASEYAAALALGYLNFYDSNGSDDDKAKYENYLKVAKDLFEFAEKNPKAFNEWGVNLDETLQGKEYPGFYESQSYIDDMALAAGWLHLADPNGGYKAKFDKIEKKDDKWFSWNDVTVAVYAVGAHIGSNNWSKVASAIDGKIDKNSPDNYFKQDGWGSARYNAIMQTAALVAAKHDQDTETYKAWAQGQMNLLLGGNSWKNTLNGVCNGGTVSGTTSPICLVTNFVPDGVDVDTPQAPHHRAASGWDSLDEYKVNCGYDDDSYALIGAMVGGPAFGNHDDGKQLQMHAYNHDHPLANHTYIDCLHDYCCNEVSIDYNVGLVGAAVGLYYFYGEGARSTMIEGVEYGAYGLDEPDKTVDGDIKSPTDSAVAKAETTSATSVSEEEALAVLTAFSMRQTAVRILGDSDVVESLGTNIDFGSTIDIDITYPISKIAFSMTYNKIEPWGGYNFNFTYYDNEGGNKQTTVQEHSGWFEFTLETPKVLTKIDIGNVSTWDATASIDEIKITYQLPSLSITSEKDNVTEGDTIHLESKDKKENSTVTWKLGDTILGTDDSCDFHAPAYVEGETNEYTITASDGTNTATKTLTIDPLAFTEDSITIEGFNAEQTLELNSDRPLTDFNWTPTDSEFIKVENGIITAKKTTTNPITITATDKNNPEISASIQVSANVPVEALTISGESTTEIGGEITLTKSGGPHEALSYKWTSLKPSIATVDQNGKVTGVAAGSVTIILEAYSGPDQTGTVLESVEKEIIIQNIRVKEVAVNKTINRTEKYLLSLEDIPTNAKIQSITVNLNGSLKSDQIYHRTYITEDWEITNKHKPINDSGETECDFTGSGSIVWDTSSFSDEIPVGQENSKYAFEIWWSDDNTQTVTITSIVIKYETDGRELNLTTDKTTIRKGEDVNLTINAVGGEVAELTASPSGIVELPTTFANGVYTITPIAAGEVTITAKIDDSLTKSLKLIIKDDITINGSDVMDINASQRLTVNNAIGTITWGAAEGIEYTVNGEIITFSNGATLNIRTGEVKSSSNGGELTITATDSHDGKTSEITIFISEKPKIPELPKNVFLETAGKITLTADNLITGNDNSKVWQIDLLNLPMTDAKGNPYYYYIQESGYKQTENSPEKPLTDTVGHYIHSSNGVYMPVSYYNNGIIPVENGDPAAVAKVENKLTETIQGQLPSTGGSGARTYYYFGGALMLLGIAGFTGLKRRERKRRKE